MTVVNGLRLAYRGFITGLAAGYVWLATALVIGALLDRDSLFALRPIVGAILPGADPEAPSAFVLAFALVQLASATVGMVFAYFFARFFTIRGTVAIAAPCFALLAWALLAVALGARTGEEALGLTMAPLLATVAYGLLLGASLPLRGEVLRGSDGATSAG
jgi:hypothetical protein